MTLIEILMVLAILSVMLAFSAAAYWNSARQFKEQGVAAQVDVLLRRVRNSAVTANAPAYVEIDTANRRITPYACSVVGLWHFEDRDAYGHTTGARKHGAVMRGAELYKEGKIGKCARLFPNAYIDCGAEPDFDCEDGGYLEAYIRSATYSFDGDSYIFFKNGAYDLKITRGGRLVGDVGRVHVTSSDYHIVPGRWTKVAMGWDNNCTRILVDDCILATAPGAKPAITNDPLLIGHDTASLEGLVDEARVLSAIKGAPLELQPSFTLTHTAQPWNAIYFAGDGSLDMRYHAGPVSITVEQDGRARMVSVSMLGETLREEVAKVEKKPAPPVYDDAEAAARKKAQALEQAKKIKLVGDEKAAKPGANDDKKK